MRRLTGVVGKDGKFVIGKTRVTQKHDGYREESREMQRLLHSAELIQPFLADGTRNTAYSTIYHEQAISQGIIDKDAAPDFHKFE